MVVVVVAVAAVVEGHAILQSWFPKDKLVGEQMWQGQDDQDCLAILPPQPPEQDCKTVKILEKYKSQFAGTMY